MRKSPRPAPSRPVKSRSERTSKPRLSPPQSTVLRPKTGRKELKYYGTAACLALWQHRPDDIIRVYVQPQRLELFGAMLKWAASRRLAYHLVEAGDLERLTESVHHQGICVLARDAAETSFDTLRHTLKQRRCLALLYLDGVANPHNLGAILRVCAHFGIEFILAPCGSAKISPSAARVAEGGAEYVRTIYLNHPQHEIAELKRLGFSLIAAAANANESLFGVQLSKRTVLILGGEEQGLSAWAQSSSDKIVSIPGTGSVESLNVATACAVLAAEYVRQHPLVR